MDFTSRMLALRASLRRERNGAVADQMRCYGARYGLNYGVSLPTVREIARRQAPDHDFARYLYQQDVRELRLAALHIAEPSRLTPAEFPVWAAGIVNSEVAGEAAFALLSRSEVLPQLFEAWTMSENPLLQYAALMAASRSENPRLEWIERAVELVRRNASSALPTGPEYPGTAAPRIPVVPKFPGSAPKYLSARPLVDCTSCLTAQGAVALLAAIGSQNEENRLAVLRAAGSLGKLPAEDFVHEELAWRLNGQC